jgi:hypothetical protein
MIDVISRFLTDKAARNNAALAALLVTSVSVGGPWNGA